MVDAADYARAERLCSANLVPRVRNAHPAPIWIGETGAFVYRREDDAGHAFLRVDAATGDASPAFDHDALAAALRAAGVAEADAARLPVELLECGDDGGFVLAAGASRYRFDGESCWPCDPPAGDGLSHAPDGRHAVSARDGNLYLHGPDGAVRPLTSDGTPEDGYGVYYDNWKAGFIPRSRSGKPYPPFGASWSPCSRWLIVPRIDQRDVAPYPFIESLPADGGFRPKVHLPRIPLMGEEPARASWHVFDVEAGTGHRIDLPEGLFFVHQDALLTRHYWWSSDGARAYVLAHGDNMGSAMLFDVELATGAVRTVIEDRVEPRADLNGSSYNPPNVWILGDLEEVIWFSVRDGWGHLYLYDGRSGALKRQLTQGAWFVRDLIRVDRADRVLVFTAAGREGGNPYHRRPYRLSLDGGEPVLLSPEPEDHELGHMLDEAGPHASPVSPCGRFLVCTCSTVDRAPRTLIRSAVDGALIAPLVEADVSGLLAEGYRPPQPFTAKAADGVTELFGLMHLPPAIEPGRRYPVIVSQYTTPIAPASPKTYMRAIMGSAGRATPAMLAELGFVVISLDPRGTGFRGRAIDGAIDGRLNLIGTDDYAAAIAELGARFDWIDAGRVGIYGGSYGGFTVIRAMLEFPEVFTVGIASVPMGAVHNMYPDYHWMAYQGRPVYADGSPHYGHPGEVPANYAALDANRQAARLAGDLLIILGELDENVLPGSTLQFIAALVEADRPFDMVLLPGASHGTVGRTHHHVRRHFDYFVEHLLDEKPPRDFRFTVLPQTPEPDLSDAFW